MTAEESNEVTIWRIGDFVKVYCADTKIIRQLANADNCKLGASYFYKGRLAALDCILPYRRKSLRRVLRVLKDKGFATPRQWPNKPINEQWTVTREPSCAQASVA